MPCAPRVLCPPPPLFPLKVVGGPGGPLFLSTHSQIKAAIAPGLAPGDDAVAALGALSASALGGGNPPPPCEAAGAPPPSTPLVTAANSVWARPPLAFTPPFLARAAALDAAAHPLTTAAAINAWCAGATAGRIKEIVDEGACAAAVAILANALYFKGAWATPFNRRASGPGPFYAGPRTSAGAGDGDPDAGRPLLAEGVHFMGRAADKAARLLTAPGACTALRLAYGGGGGEDGEGAAGPYEGVIILQEDGVGVGDALAAVEAGYEAEAAEQEAGVPTTTTTATLGEEAGPPAPTPASPAWRRPLAGVNIRLPAFTVDAGLALGPALQALGVTAAFSPAADFSAMLAVDGGAGEGGGAQPIPVATSIADVLHRVWIATDEEGTEAAAATAVVMVRSMLAAPELFHADHPFLFGVRHGPSGAWLFLGRVGTPAVWKGGVDGGGAGAAVEGSSAGCSGPGLAVR